MQTSRLYWIVWLMAMTSLAYAENPKVTLKIKNQEEVYMSDNVTLECSIKSDLPNWKYHWYAWRLSAQLQDVYGILEDTNILQVVLSFETEVYWCAAVRDDHPYYFEFSNSVTLTVQEKPKATLKMRRPVHIGDTLTLNCSIEGVFTGWRYTWYKLNWTGGSDLLYETTEDTYTVQSVTQSDAGVYWCAGERDGRLQYSEPSNAVTLSIQEKRKVVLKMRSEKEVIYEGDNVTLECRIEGGLPGWRYHWFKSSWENKWMEITGTTADTYTMESVSFYDSREYWCWAVRDDPPDYSEVSNTVTVNLQGELNETLKTKNNGPLYVGGNVTLKCSFDSSFNDGGYNWRKWSWTEGMEQLYTGNAYIIPSVTQSDNGLYCCSDFSPSSHLIAVFLLSAQATQKVTLKIKNPKIPFYIGDNVTLECSSEGDLSGWTYRWYHWSHAGMWNELKNTTQDTYTLQSVAQSDGGKYWCYAFTDDPLHYTEFSNAVTLTVKVDYLAGNGIQIGLSCLVLIVLLVLMSECFWIRVLLTGRSAESDSERHKVI
ncbi:Fc receptor-like protein 5 isoform X2 [Polypterus senegalus]|uniref:Fc receptor-like protein 5 isoform X2 n=1 Tax=Polypterus senegalus TaxID=55291 RepID=UPI001966AA8B|nr:Fc receptor-like protein 5 isoform X2 [Polypterus senegalus]